MGKSLRGGISDLKYIVTTNSRRYRYDESKGKKTPLPEGCFDDASKQ
jgi:hypothetical protein